MQIAKRKVDIAVISDVHLGTYGCHARELLNYLKSIDPGILILNGDIIDIWQFSKRYWPKSHMKIIKHITKLIGNGVDVRYITGNHDEMLRKFDGFQLGSFSISNKQLLQLKNGKAWIFHGDVFDVSMKHSKWLAKLGGAGYDMLIVLNRMVNFLLNKIGRDKISLSKRIKNSVKSAVKFINDFEGVATDIGISNGYSYVLCGHIHQPVIKTVQNQEGEIVYLNSGDWVENLTSLEYNKGKWELYKYDPLNFINEGAIAEVDAEVELCTSILFKNLVAEFNTLRV